MGLIMVNDLRASEHKQKSPRLSVWVMGEAEEE